MTRWNGAFIARRPPARKPFREVIPMLPPALLRLSDSQLEIVMAIAQPLPVELRPNFLSHVAAALADKGELGDGVVSRTCRELFREYFDPPITQRAGGVTKWGSG
jgi:hypothetical protein